MATTAEAIPAPTTTIKTRSILKAVASAVRKWGQNGQLGAGSEADMGRLTGARY
jgi:hypothetical protein